MAYLKKKNCSRTTLSSSVSAVSTSITVSDATQLPSTTDFLVTVWNKSVFPDPCDDPNSEIMRVTNINGNILTVSRAQEDSTAHSHSSGHAVELLITAGHFKEIEDAIDSITAGEEILTFIDNIDCSANPNYPEAVVGDLYRVSVAGKIGGGSGPIVDIGNLLLCIANSISGDHATVGSNWTILGGDMRKSVYDSDGDGRVDEAESLNDGINFLSTNTVNIAVNKAHDQNTDTKLDEGGANELSVVQIKDAFDKRHTQNTDTILDQGGANQISASDLKILNDTTVPAKADKVDGATDGNLASLDENGNLEDSGFAGSDFADVDHDHDDDYLNKANTDPFTPDADYEPATKKYVDDSISASGGGDMSKTTYDTNSNNIVDKAESIDDGGGNTASAVDIADAVTKKHEHTNKALLDTYNQTNANITDAISKRHTQNTDTGTNQNSFDIGDGNDTTKSLFANNGDGNKPTIRYNHSLNIWQYSHNGVDFFEFGLSETSGDMLKSVYDQDDDGIVDEAESVNDGTFSASAEDIADAVSKRHIQNTDTKLDEGGANEVTASQAKTAYDHTSLTNNPHSVTKTQVGLGDVPNLDTTDAVANEHVQNTDTNTNSNDFGIGDGTDSNKTITIQNAFVNKPKIRFNASSVNWEYSNDGTNYFNFGVASGGAGSGDMTKATYDTNDNGIVDKAESLDDGTNSISINEVLKGFKNVALLGFKLSIENSLSKYNLVDGFIDEFEDEDGIDSGSLANYDNADKFYEAPGPSLDAETKLLLHCNGTNGSTSFPDTSASGHTVTAIGNAQVSTADPVFGTGALLCDGGDALSIPYSDDWDFGSGEFTVDFWVKFNNPGSTAEMLVSKWDNTGGNDSAFQIYKRSGSILHVLYSTTGSNFVRIASTYTFSDTDWHHVAVVRDGDTLRFFVDGTAQGTGNLTGVTIFDSIDTLTIGAEDRGGSLFNTLFGSMDEIRVSKGVARWTTDFTPPVAEYGPFVDMELISEPVVAESAPTQGRIYILMEETDSITLNTDLKAFISRDDGANYEEVTLQDDGVFIGDTRFLSGVDDFAGSSDTNIVWKLISHNEKLLKIHGVGMLYD